MSLLEVLDAAGLTNVLLGALYAGTAAFVLHSTGHCRRPAPPASAESRARTYGPGDEGGALAADYQIHFFAGAANLTLPPGRSSLVVANAAASGVTTLAVLPPAAFTDARARRFGALRFEPGQAQHLVWCAEKNAYALAVAGCSFEGPLG